MNKVKLLLGIMFVTVILLNPKKIWAQESYGYEVLTETEDAGDEKEISLTVKLTDYKKQNLESEQYKLIFRIKIIC